MKVAVIGAGVIGISTAYELAAQGHQVTVFEKRGAAAEECSFANAGVASTGYAFPWAQPGMVKHVLTHLWKRDSPLRITHPSLKEWHWLWQWRKACDDKTFALNRERMLRLATYSDQRRRSLSTNLGLEHERQNGFMVLLRTDSEKKRMQSTLQAMRDAGLSYNPLNADEARNIEPALRPETPLAQAIYFPDDEVSNCRQFTLLLKNKAEALGVQFHFNTPIEPLSRATPQTICRANTKGSERFDAVVVSAGMASAALVKPLGVRIPLAAVHGYAISAAVREPLDAPRSGVMDERYKVAITRLGQRIRITGGSELGGHPTRQQAESLQTLYRVLDDWFPGAARTQENVQIWKGARPMLPDGPPLVGASGVAGVWLNLGHGASGWTLASGSARIIANSISGQRSEIDLQGLGLERLSH